MKVIVEADGGSRGNPGNAGFGAVVVDPETRQVLLERLGALGTATNNVAEYRGLIAGLRAAADLGADEVDVRMDSKLVVEQMSGRWQIKNPGLRPLAAEAATLVKRFRSVTFNWIPRECNQRADRLANAAMDGKPAPDLEAPAPVAAASVPAPAASWSPRTDEPTRLYLVRHAETDHTARRLYSGRGDVALSARGRDQARAVAGRLAARGVTAVVTSPLSRCVATATEIAVAAGGLPVQEDSDLVECDFGKWEGLTFGEVRERWPAEMAAWLASSAVPPPGGESFDDVAARVGRASARIRDAYPAGRVAVVSHVSPLKLILRAALDGGPAFLHRCYLDPAAVSTVDYWSDGGVAVRAVNEIPGAI